MNFVPSKRIFEQLKPGDTLAKPALIVLLQNHYPDAKKTTLDWHIYDLVQQGILARQGRGRYLVTPPDQHYEPGFNPEVPAELRRLGKKVKAAFPLLSICLWATSTLHPFVQQQPFITYWLIETEREAVDSVVDYIRDYQQRTLLKTPPVIRADDLAFTERYQPNSSIILLVKPLISEAPLQRADHGLMVPTAEKIVVDLLADTDIFSLFSEELPQLFTEFDKQFVLNLDRLRRYARRRHKLSVLDTYLMSLPSHA